MATALNIGDLLQQYPGAAKRFWRSVRIGKPDECWCWAGDQNSNRYGRFRIANHRVAAHRAAFVLSGRELPTTLLICHRCDVRLCCNPAHLFAGTAADNIHDMVNKQRHAHGATHGARKHPDRCPRGERHGSRTHPECLPRGDEHYARRHPEKLSRGDRHYARTHPEKLARGDRSGARLHPERIPRGDQHYSRMRPERLARGERHGQAKLTAEKVIEMRRRYAAGGVSQRQLARDYGVTRLTVSRILEGRLWRHIVYGIASAAS